MWNGLVVQVGGCEAGDEPRDLVQCKAVFALYDLAGGQGLQAKGAVGDSAVESQTLLLAVGLLGDALEVVDGDDALLDCFQQRLHDQVITDDHLGIGQVEGDAGRNAVDQDGADGLGLGCVHVHVDGKGVDLCQEHILAIELNEQAAVLAGHQFGSVQGVILRHCLLLL